MAIATTERLTGPPRDEAMARAHELQAQGYTYRQIADDLGLKYTQMPRLMTQVRKRYKRNGTARTSKTRDLVEAVDALGYRDVSTQPVHAGESDTDHTFKTVDQRRAALRAYLGTTWQDKRVYVAAPTDTRCIVAVGDLHGKPDPMVLAGIIEREPDIVVVGGDTTDQQYASSHPPETKAEVKRRNLETRKGEQADLRAWFETLLDNIAGEVHVFLGNHDIWTLKQAHRALPGWMVELFPEPVDLLLYGLGERVKRVGYPVRYHHAGGSVEEWGQENEFMYVLGDVLFSHLNYTNSVTESGVSKLFRKWFFNWSAPLGLDHIHAIVHFHVHSRIMKNARGGHMLLIEPGMGGSVAAETYKFGYQGKWRPSVQGFVRLTQYRDDDDWRTDLASVELVAPRLARGG